MSEVPLGAFLSGGLDSSLVVSAMARALACPVLTNAIGFDDHAFNELPVAAAVAAHLKCDHHEVVVQPKAAEILNRIAWHFDEPLADSSAVPTWYVCEMARRTVTVALSGDGGDESFGGYTFRYLPHMAEARVRAALPAAVRRAVFGPLGSLWPASARLPKPLRLKTILENLAVGDAEAYFRDLVWLRADARSGLYSAEFKERLRGFTPMETVEPYYSGGGGPDALSRAQFADINFYMTDDVLVKVDRMSMAHALEVRCPLLDHRIIEFAAALPTGMKLDRHRGKLVLRELASRHLPPSVLEQPKRGFSIPAARWLREDLRPMVEKVIFRRDGVVADALNASRVRMTWQEHLSAKRDHSVFIWGLLMLGLWEDCRDMTEAPA
jgi:asparagine synthase (glutamine-hydrolysing)